MSASTQRDPLSRWLVVVGALALAATVLLASWGSYRTVRNAQFQLFEAEAESIWRNVTMSLFEGRTTSPTSRDLELTVARFAGSGLRYLAIVGPSDEVIVDGGTPLAPLDRVVPPRHAGPSVQRLGSFLRVRGNADRPQRRPVPPPPPAAAPPPPRQDPGARADRPPRPRADGGPTPRRYSPPRRGDGGPAERSGSSDSAPPPGPPRVGDPVPGDRDPAPQEDRAQDGDEPQSRQPPPPLLVLDVDPQWSVDLERATRQALGTGFAAALALVVGGAAFRQLLHQRDQVQREVAERRRLASLGEMSAVLAHEVRNPLASLKGNAQLLAEVLPEGGNERRKAERLVLEVRRLQQLSDDLLELSREGPIDQRPLDPAVLARDAVEEARALDPTVTVELEVRGSLGSWPLDGTRLVRALSNVLANAIQASSTTESGDARVMLRVREEGDRLVFEVLDRGPGIPAEVRERLFEPFVTTRARGTGLGLAVAGRIVEMHGGRMVAEDRPGGGTVLRLELPADGRTADA